MASKWRLDGCKILVTGSTKGIGLSVAKEVLQLGSLVWIVSRNQDDVDKTVSELCAEYGEGKAVGSAADISKFASAPEFSNFFVLRLHVNSEEGRKKLISAVGEKWGVLDSLVNNAGTNTRKPVLQATADEYDSIVRTNMDSCYFLCKAAHPLLVKGKSPSIVNVGSVAGVGSTGSGGIYAMTKAAVGQLTKTLACEWAKNNIRVNCVAPWVTKTPLLAEAIKNDPTSMDKVKIWTPLQRPAEPEEIASAVVFMLLPASSYCTGQTLSVDGGLTANVFAGPCLE